MISVKVNLPSGTIILDRVARCNALSRTIVSEIREALDDLRQEKKVRGIIITGAGANFCSGMDVKEWRETASSDQAMQTWFSDAHALQSLLEEMLRFPKPIIAAVDGAVVGAGLAICLASDLIVASHRATFSVPSSKLGLVSGLTVPLLAFRAGASVASQIVIGGSELSAAEAKNVGLVQHVVEADQVWVRAQGWIDSIADGAAESIQLTKKVLNEMVGEQLLTMLSSGAAATATALTTEAAQEGINAFCEKRPPEFP